MLCLKVWAASWVRGILGGGDCSYEHNWTNTATTARGCCPFFRPMHDSTCNSERATTDKNSSHTYACEIASCRMLTPVAVARSVLLCPAQTQTNQHTPSLLPLQPAPLQPHPLNFLQNVGCRLCPTPGRRPGAARSSRLGPLHVSVPASACASCLCVGTSAPVPLHLCLCLHAFASMRVHSCLYTQARLCCICASASIPVHPCMYIHIHTCASIPVHPYVRLSSVGLLTPVPAARRHPHTRGHVILAASRSPQAPGANRVLGVAVAVLLVAVVALSITLGTRRTPDATGTQMGAITVSSSTLPSDGQG